MNKSILILKGSPRKKGNSAVLADQVFSGAKKAGAEVEDVYLSGLNINPCDACDACQTGNDGCIVQDDMQSLYPKIERADVIVIASPIYFFTINAQTKLCIDRWYAFEAKAVNPLRGKQLAIVLVYGDTVKAGSLGRRKSFADIGQSLASFFHLERMDYGTSFL